MNTKHGILLLCIGLLLVFASVGTASGKIWYVDDDGGTDFMKIQDAIDAAYEGDTIFVYNGTYIEHLTIDKNNLTILGEDRNTTVIDGHGYEGDVVTIGGDSCTVNCMINGFTIKNSGVYDAGIATKCSRGINISNNILKNNRNGISSLGYWCACEGYELRAGHNIITQNIISDNNGAGISAGSSENIISHNTIFSNNWNGISCHSDNNTISDNNISYNEYTNIDLSSSKNNIIANNTIAGSGIVIASSCYYNTIINNTILSNYEGEENISPGRGAVYIHSSNHNYVIANTFNKTFGAIRLKEANYNLIRDNNILNNYRGIDIDSSNNNLLYHNNLINNTEQAIDDGSNSWDNGSIEGGNYWSNHNCTGNPSNGSEPYYIEDEWPTPTPEPTAAPTPESEQYYSEGGSVDHYPFEDPNGWIFQVIAHFSYSPENPIINQLITFDASSSTGNITDYEWDFGDGSNATGIIATHSYSANETYTVNLTVTDDNGATDTTSTAITISTTFVIARFRYSPENPIINQLITFNASSSTGNITSYEWDFGDGSNATGIIATHSYSANGTYTVNLTVTEDNGATDTATTAITVISGPKIIYVPNDYSTIQDAIDAANESDTIFVYNGSYYEHISISKSLTLVGENRTANIIGLGSGSCIYITASNVTIDGFTIRNGDYGVSIENNACDNAIINNTITLNHQGGVETYYMCNNSSIINNTIIENDGPGIILGYKTHNSSVSANNISLNGRYGIYLYYSTNNLISKNNIDSNGYEGIKLTDWCDCGSDNNVICENTISNNDEGIVFEVSSHNDIYKNNISMNRNGNLIFKDGSNYNNATKNTVINGKVAFEDTYFNTIYHNNFILSPYTVTDAGSTNSWDNGSTEGGNYWSDHNCSGNPSNGSEPYIIDADSIDHYPFEDPNGWMQLEDFSFDTGSGTYPSIMGTHNGTITPSQTITVNKLYTYSCTGTGGHSEYAIIWNETIGECAIAEWAGYIGDYHNISFNKTLTLEKGVIYNYTIRTGSYPQIHHTDALPTKNGWINCTEFTDANGKKYDDWIPAIKLE